MNQNKLMRRENLRKTSIRAISRNGEQLFADRTCDKKFRIAGYLLVKQLGEM